MREILFRGKTAKGEWVQGAYYKQKEFYGDEENIDCIITTSDVLSNDLGLDYEEVITETIGQFTGLTDKNGKKIFEGDIILFSHPAFIKDITVPVKWNKDELGFEAVDGGWVDYLWYGSDFYEVIGNIHDNPELLEK